MATYLDTSKIQAAGRVTLGPSALRNLNVNIGDSVEIFFDESLGKILISPVKSGESMPDPTRNGKK